MSQKEDVIVMSLSLPDAAYEMIDRLIDARLWGDTRADVVRALVLDALKAIGGGKL